MSNKKTIKGGEFLIKETPANDIFIPEQYDEEQKHDCSELSRLFRTRNLSGIG